MKKIIGFTICVLAFAALLGWVVMTLWNNVLAEVLPVSLISFWQALGILLLSKILFGGIKGKFGGGPRHIWGREMREKWQHMSPEDREKMKQEWRDRCNMWKSRGKNTGNGEGES
ncbi:hypothetical protein GWC94_01845 [Sediminibacterium sp. WSJ-3]|nr:hypothetical protein [Sediminibacterium soli]